MTNDIKDILSGAILEEESALSLRDLCGSCSVRAVEIVEMVEEGLLEPSGREPHEWRFSGSSLMRAQTAVRLRRDLDVNLPGAALILDLLDEIDRLQRRISMQKG